MEKQIKEIKYCRHLVPQDAEHFCNKCHAEYEPDRLTYDEVIERFDDEIEGYDYMLNEVELRKEKFIEKYGNKKRLSNSKVEE